VQMLWFLHERWKVRLDDGTYISFKLRARPPWEVQARIAFSCTVQCYGGCSYVGSLCTRLYTFMMHIHACLRVETMRIRTPQTCSYCTNLRHTLSEIVVIVACVRGSIPASTLDTLRNDIRLNRAPTETILRKTHLAACEHMRRMIHTRRAIETLTVGPQGIVTKLFQRDKMRRGRPPHGNAPPNTSRPRRHNG